MIIAKWSAGKIFKDLLKRIMNLDIAPGSKLTETELSQEYNVSRTPVREALQHLSVKGYVVIKPKNGCYVRQLDLLELDEYYDIRVALELEALELISKNTPYLKVKELAEKWDPEVMRFGKTSTESLKDAEEDFHIELAALSGNTTLIKYLKDVNNNLRIIRRLGFPDDQSVHDTYLEHHKICIAILNNDFVEAKLELRKHIYISQEKGRQVTLFQLRRSH